jgi:hypothetical protein
MANDIATTHVLMGKMLTGSAAGSLAGEMKVATISGSAGLTLNAMLAKLSDVNVLDRALIRTEFAAADLLLSGSSDRLEASMGAVINTNGDYVPHSGKTYINGNANVTADLIDLDTAIAADAVHLGNLVTLSGVAEDAANLGSFGGDTITADQTVKAALQLLETEIDVIQGAGVGSIAKAVADLVDSAPAALDTLNELAEALGDDAAFSTTITNLIGGVSGSSDRLEAAMGAVINTNGDYVPHSGKAYINGNSNVTQDLIDLDVAIAADAVHLGNLVTLSGVAEDAANLGTFDGATITDNQTVKAAIQLLETKAEAVQTDVDANEAAEKLRLDHANGFHVEKDGFVWKMGWGVNAPRISFEIEADATVTMSVDKETA